MKVSELIGPMLDLWVAKAEGYELKSFKSGYWLRKEGDVVGFVGEKYTTTLWNYSPSTDWSQCGPIIERERICVTGPGPMGGPKPEYYWTAYIDTGSYAGGGHNGHGRSPLIAAMRCFVASKFGEEVDDRQAHIVQG